MDYFKDALEDIIIDLADLIKSNPVKAKDIIIDTLEVIDEDEKHKLLSLFKELK